MEYECTNPIYNANGGIDVTWNHPQFGPIPFTASPTDSEQHGRDIYDLADAGEFGTVQ